MRFFMEQGIQFKVLLGSYQGAYEVSYCVPAIHFPAIVQADLLVGEDSILELGAMSAYGYREATIVYYSGEQDGEPVGYFVAIEKEEALNLSHGWSFDPTSDKFFTIKTAAELAKAGLSVDD